MLLRTILGASIASSVASVAVAGAWTEPKGEGQAILTGAYSHSGKGYASDGRVVDIGRYDKTTLSLLIEYGLTDRTTLFAKPELRAVDLKAPGGTTQRSRGLGLSEFGVRNRFAKMGGWVIAAQASGFAPGSSNKSTNVAQAGATDAEADARLLAGRPLPLPGDGGFIDVQGGYHLRAGAAPNEYRADVTVGWRPKRTVLVYAQSFNTWADGRGRGFYDNYQYHNLSLNGAVDIAQKVRLQAGVFGTASGRNALRERGVTIGVWRRF
ncbi:hypothetical protein LJR225_001352 [Phenylobacterium sp. LjRoot225]|uniref:hypothetical protein n=1 Tax=Phenylobacterium sp. LjRoot225 TaxID=3342285 RepID=UPI003ECC9283